LCPACGYDLRGTAATGVCPECGTTFSRLPASEVPTGLSLLRQTQPGWVWTLVIAAMILVAVLRRFLS